MPLMKHLFFVTFVVFVSFPAHADLADELDDLVGYTIIASKTIDRWYDDDEKDDSFNGCSHGRVIVFTDGTTLTCAEYGYQYVKYVPAVVFSHAVGNYGAFETGI